MTLTGIHEPGEQLPAGWRVSRLLPLSVLSLMSLSTVTAVAHSLTTTSIPMALYNLTLAITTLFCMALLVWWCTRRHAVHRLMRLQSTLELGQTPRKGDNSAFLRQGTALTVLCFGIVATTVAAFVNDGRFEHPYYMLPLYVPEALQTPAWYPAVLSVQFASQGICTTCLVSFGLILPGLVDAVALQLSRILRELRDLFPDTDDDQPSAPNAAVKLQQVAAWTETVSAAGDLEKKKPAAAAAADGPDVALQLRRLSDRYREVFRLSSNIADTFSPAVLSLFTVTTAVLLVGGYVLVAMMDGRLQAVADSGLSYYLFIVVYMLCMCGISVTGSRLIQQSTQLHDVISKELWPRQMTPAVRHQLRMVLEQTRVPLEFDVSGVFTLQKSSVLSVLSFVLTYFVIMLQMIR